MHGLCHAVSLCDVRQGVGLVRAVTCRVPVCQGVGLAWLCPGVGLSVMGCVKVWGWRGLFQGVGVDGAWQGVWLEWGCRRHAS